MPQIADQPMNGGRRARTPIKLAGGALAILAAVAGLIGNLDRIREFLQPSVEGAWMITNTVEESTFSPYRGLSVTYQVFLTHDGRQLTGTGEKVMENGKAIPVRAHSPIEIDGGVEGGRVIARFVLKPAPDGAARETRGQFEWHAMGDGFLSRKATRLEGTFSSTGASSRGRSIGVRPGV